MISRLLAGASAPAAGLPAGQATPSSSVNNRLRELGSFLVTGSLLLSTLAPVTIPLPLSADKGDLQFLQVQHPGKNLRPNADTSQGMGRALRGADTTVRVKDYPFLTVDRVRPVVDTSRGSPDTLLLPSLQPLPPGQKTPQAAPVRYWFQPPDTSQQAWAGTIPAAAAVAPFKVAPGVTPQKVWQVADTSQSAWAVQIPAVAQPSATKLTTSAPFQLRWQPADSSQSSAKVTYGDLQAPVGAATPQTALAQPVKVLDTSQSLPLVLVASTPPFVVLPTVAPDRAHWQTQDTSQTAWAVLQAVSAPFAGLEFLQVDRSRNNLPDTTQQQPKVLYGDATVPVSNLQQTPPDRVRAVVDTSQGTGIALTIPVTPPVVNLPGFAPYKFWWQPADTSAGSAKVTFTDATVPVFNAPQLLTDRVRAVVDTTQQSPPVTTAVLPPPVVVAPGFQVARAPAVTDSSQSSSPALLQLTAPPVVPPEFLAPVRFWYQPRDTSQAMAKVLFVDGQMPFANPQMFLQDRVRPVADTSFGMTGVLRILGPVWPLPSQVLIGVVYGPNGNDYTGTLVPGSGGAHGNTIRRGIWN